MPSERRAAREMSANSARFVGESALPLLRESKGTLRELHLDRDAIGGEALKMAVAQLTTRGQRATFSALRVLQLVGAMRYLASVEDGTSSLEHLAAAAPNLEALEIRELDLAASVQKTTLSDGRPARGAELPRVLAKPLTHFVLAARALKVLWIDNLWLDGLRLAAAATDADRASTAPRATAEPLVDVRLFAVERDRRASDSGDAGLAGLVHFLAAKRPNLQTFVAEGANATILDRGPLDALGRHPALRHLSLAHANVSPAALAPLLETSGFPNLETFSKLFDQPLDSKIHAARPHLRIRPFAKFSTGFQSACTRAGVHCGLHNGDAPASS